MAEYIDRADLIKNLNKFAPEHYTALVNQLITKQPTADVVEVVRCKDCKYWNNGYCEGIPFCGDDASYIETQETDFCSYGERKDVSKMEITIDGSKDE